MFSDHARVVIDVDMAGLQANLREPWRMKTDIGQSVAYAEEAILKWGGFDKLRERLSEKAEAEHKPQRAENFVLSYERNKGNIDNETRELAYTLNEIYSLGNTKNIENLEWAKTNGLDICRTVLCDDKLAEKFEYEDFEHVKEYAREKLNRWDKVERGELADAVFENNETIASVQDIYKIASTCADIKKEIVPEELFDYFYGKYFIRNASKESFVKLGEHIRQNYTNGSKTCNVRMFCKPEGAEGAITYGCRNANIQVQNTQLFPSKTSLKGGVLPPEFNEQVYLLTIYYNEVGA